jgi:hypothetical protein
LEASPGCETLTQKKRKKKKKKKERKEKKTEHPSDSIDISDQVPTE